MGNLVIVSNICTVKLEQYSKNFVQIHSVSILGQAPVWSNSLHANLSVELDVVHPQFNFLFGIPEYIYRPNLWRVFKFIVVNLS